MGQPKFPRKKYDTPNHPWQGDRIKEENEVVKKFGLKNKREIWRAQTRLREIRSQARTLVSRTRNPDDAQAATEAKNLLSRLNRQGYVGEEATLNEVLGLDMERILNRRLQSQVYLKGMARTPKQARQFVNHGLIRIGRRRVDVPSYVVSLEEEGLIEFDPTAAVADPSHPVRPRAPGQDEIELARHSEEAAKAVEAGSSGSDDVAAAEAATAEPTEAAAGDDEAAPAASDGADDQGNAKEAEGGEAAAEASATETDDKEAS